MGICVKCNEREWKNAKSQICARCYMREYKKRPGVEEKQAAYRNSEEGKAGSRERSLAHYHRNKNKWSDRYYQQTYGITRAERDAMLERQGGKCAICRAETTFRGRGGAHLDHCHKTGKIREVLCSSCNQALGAFNDDPNLLRRAASHIEKHRGDFTE